MNVALFENAMAHIFPFLLRNSLQRQKLWMSSLCMLFKVWSLTNNWVNKTGTTTQSMLNMSDR